MSKETISLNPYDKKFLKIVREIQMNVACVQRKDEDCAIHSFPASFTDAEIWKIIEFAAYAYECGKIVGGSIVSTKYEDENKSYKDPNKPKVYSLGAERISAVLNKASVRPIIPGRVSQPNHQLCLEDSSPMPWGKYKGKLMQDVPASYLFYLWTEQNLENEVSSNPVASYINDNLSALKQEYTDGEWGK